MTNLRPKLLELFAGVGGAAVAFQDQVDIVAAIDINKNARAVYEANFSHPYLTKSIESLSAESLKEFEAEIWWMSPPCQPFTRRGLNRDDRDTRSAALKKLIDAIDIARPETIILENVAGFQNSRTRELLIRKLTDCGYHSNEYQLCATEFGIPNNRPRYYLVASQTECKKLAFKKSKAQTLHKFLDKEVDERFWIDPKLLGEKINGLNIVNAQSDSSICFTSAYGRWLKISGSFISDGDRLRRFTPKEVSRLLGFPEPFRMPSTLNDLQLWKLLGNSISVFVVRHLLNGHLVR